MSAIKQKRYYDSLKLKGLVKRSLVVHKDDWQAIKAYASKLKREREEK